MMRGIILIVMLLGSAVANADTPFYAGLGFGKTRLSQDKALDLTTHNFSDDTAGWKALIGYELSANMDSNWAFELSYTNFGKAESSASRIIPPPPIPNPPPPITFPSALTFEAWGYSLEAIYHLPLGDYFSVDGSIGWTLGDSETREWSPGVLGPVYVESHKDSGAVYGLAATFRATEILNIRVVGNYYSIDFDGVIDNPYRLGVDFIVDF